MGADEKIVTLSAEAKAVYDQHMQHCKAAWRTTEDPLVIAEALANVFLFRQPLPAWVEAAAVSIVIGQRTAEHARNHREATQHLWRHACFQKVYKPGEISQRKAAERVKEILNGTGIANVEPEEIIKSWKQVREDLAAGLQAKYFVYLRGER
jgi:hypothetical protein